MCMQYKEKKKCVFKFKQGRVSLQRLKKKVVNEIMGNSH